LRIINFRIYCYFFRILFKKSKIYQLYDKDDHYEFNHVSFMNLMFQYLFQKLDDSELENTKLADPRDQSASHFDAILEEYFNSKYFDAVQGRV